MIFLRACQAPVALVLAQVRTVGQSHSSQLSVIASRLKGLLYFFGNHIQNFIHNDLILSVFLSCYSSAFRRTVTASVGCPSAFRLSLPADRKSTRLNSSHVSISYAVF